MKILHISDTHGQHHSLKNLPETDVLIHSGDITLHGTEDETMDFLEWFCDLPYKHKVFIYGNHDTCLKGANIGGLPDNVHFLCNRSIVIDGIKIFGLPYGFGSNHIDDIPDNTDIIVSHEPPYGILDCANETSWGSEELLMKVTEVNPKLHLFGHIHTAYGQTKIGDAIFANSALQGESIELIHLPQIFEV